MADLSRLLESIGKKIFIDYYYEFNKPNLDKKALSEKLLRENPNAESITGQVTRVNCAIRIFENGLQIEALENIINSRVDGFIIKKAKDILKLEK
ncbi:hypothetical protein [Paenibacillus sp. RC21]|uniref:hypothetical protein n=1 Tax=Paenibacillus sp. RC21 TaxID=3156312 RepID=UPI003833351C